MVVLGLLLMLACAGLVVDAVIENTNLVQVIAFDRSISDLTVGTLFTAGAVVGLLFAIGLMTFVGGIGSAIRARRARRADDDTAYPDDTTRTTSDTSGRHRAEV